MLPLRQLDGPHQSRRKHGKQNQVGQEMMQLLELKK
jgi:hypothetical protein